MEKEIRKIKNNSITIENLAPDIEKNNKERKRLKQNEKKKKKKKKGNKTE